ncbi:hypothetical protein PT974_08057 [Cladobotryum mycophilum]|uniref:Uncharacterized protein n=1 Tax=Cladobotryum mycophilum TaxID=491253 RepID=A0ABR0SDR7_9HYPO
MKLSYLIGALIPSTALASENALTWGLIPQPDPQNWAAGPQLLPFNGILGRPDDYTADSFGLYVSNFCRQFTGTVVSHSYSSVYHGNLTWVGVCLRANSGLSSDVTRDFVRIQDSRVYGYQRT